MSWFKVDDGMHSHRKVMRLDGLIGTAAVGLWTLAGSWSADQLTDGWIPAYAARRLAADFEELARELVRVGLWVEDERDGEKGWLFHDWAEYQPTRAQVEQKRRGAAERQARRRDSSRESPPESREVSRRDSHVESQPDSHGDSHATPHARARSRPDPSRPEESPNGDSETSPTLVETRPDVEQLCSALHQRVTANGSKAAVTEAWRREARLLLDRDERPLPEALRLVEWCQAHHFWRSNILSMKKFRAQYDRLRLQSQEAQRPRSTSKQDRIDALGALMDPEDSEPPTLRALPGGAA